MNHKMWHALKYMIGFAWKYKKSYLIFLAAEQLLYLMFGLVTVVFPGYILNALFEKEDFALFLEMAGVYCGLYLFLKSAAQYIRTQIYRCSYSLSMRFSIYIGEVTANINFKYLEEENIMSLHDRAINCVYNGGFFGPLENLFSLFKEILMMAGVIFILVKLNLFLILLCLITTGLVFFMNYQAEKKLYDFEVKKVNPERKRRYLLSLFDDYAFGKEIRIYGLFPFLKEKLLGIFSEIYGVNRSMNLFTARYADMESVITVIQKIGIYVLLALESIKKGLGIGEFTIYFNAVNQFSGSMNTLLKGYLALAKMGLYIDDLESFIALPYMDGMEGKDIGKEGIGKESIEKEKGFCFEFVHVSFRYPGSEIYTLRDINLKIDSGERLSVVGSNGAGKTTLIKLLLRLYTPTEGKILLNKKDIHQFKYEEYIGIFSVVFQDYKLLAYSVRENICLSKAYHGKRVRSALEKSGLAEKIDSLPLGEETPLFKAYDDKGIELSGGEGQKLGIARALYKDSPIVILDEPTSALDPMAEYEIYQRFGSLVKGKTSIYISHRLASVRFADKIIVLDKGCIVEKGRHEELIKANGLYSEMYHMQAQYYTDCQMDVGIAPHIYPTDPRLEEP